jgi:hypothetical protein
MKPNEINAAVAASVMGWTQWADLSEDCPNEPGVTYFADWGGERGVAVYDPNDSSGDVAYYFNPAEDIADAWQVVARLKQKDFWPTLNYLCGVMEDTAKPGWFVRFRCVKAGTRGDHWAVDATDTVAICLAALKAGEQLRLANAV